MERGFVPKHPGRHPAHGLQTSMARWVKTGKHARTILRHNARAKVREGGLYRKIFCTRKMPRGTNQRTLVVAYNREKKKR